MKGLIKTKGGLISHWLLSQFFPECRYLFKLAWPIVLMNLFRFLNPMISVIMCGHLSKLEFDAASLANALINVFGVSVDLGFSSACDTLFAQIYGSKYKNKLGLMLQRAILVMTIMFLLLACFHLNIEPVLIFLSQDVDISRLTARYVALYLPGLFFDFHFLAISRYLQNQNIVYPMMLSAFFSCIYNAVVQYVTIYVYGYGIDASAIIQGSACFLMFSTQLAYVLITKVYKSTWQGFEFHNALEGWGIFFKLGIPGIVMIGVEEWTFEIGNFLAGALSDVQLGAQSVAFQVEVICYMIHTGLAIAVSIRTGQLLGANRPDQASLSAKVAMATDFSISCVTATIIFTLRNYLPYVFTNDKEIVSLASSILFIVGFVQFFDAGLSTSSAIFRSCGKQLKGAIVMFSTYYGIGVPIACVFIFVAKMDIRGFWYGFLIGLAVEVVVFLILVYRIDWVVEAEKAKIRIKESSLPGDTTDHSDFDVTEKSHLIRSNENSEIESIGRGIGHEFGHKRAVSGVADKLALSLVDSIPDLIQSDLKRSTVIKRLVFVGITLILFISSVLIKIYLPRGYYIPCIPLNSNYTNLPSNKHYPFCNDTIYQF